MRESTRTKRQLRYRKDRTAILPSRVVRGETCRPSMTFVNKVSAACADLQSASPTSPSGFLLQLNALGRPPTLRCLASHNPTKRTREILTLTSHTQCIISRFVTNGSRWLFTHAAVEISRGCSLVPQPPGCSMETPKTPTKKVL